MYNNANRVFAKGAKKILLNYLHTSKAVTTFTLPSLESPPYRLRCKRPETDFPYSTDTGLLYQNKVFCISNDYVIR